MATESFLSRFVPSKTPAVEAAEPPVTGMDLVQLSYLSWLENQELQRSQKYAMFRDYYEGEHQTQLTQRMRQFLELRTGQDFSLNACPIVVDSLAEKLKVATFECEGQDELLMQWWAKNRMDAQQAVVHLSAIRDGDTYVLVEWDNKLGRPRFTQENAYDGDQGLHIVYSDEYRMLPDVAIKRWTITSGTNVKTRRTNLYYPDRIEKYTDMASGSTWQPYIEVDDEGVELPWPIPWLDPQTQAPLGIPVIHFRNKDQGYSYGESELEDVIPVQNGVNKAFVDLLAAADTTGFTMYTMTGGNPAGIKVAPGSWLFHTDANVRIGQLSAADLSGLIALKDSLISDIAKITRTPLSFFQVSGEVAAEGTLKEQRSGLIAKAQDRQVVFGNSWEDVMIMARKLYNVFGDGGLDVEQEIKCVWQDDEKPDVNEIADTINKLTQAKAISTEEKIKMLHSDWSKKEIKREADAILAESGMAVPDLGPLPSDSFGTTVSEPIPVDEELTPSVVE